MIIVELYFLASWVFFALFIFFTIAYEKTCNKYVLYYALAFLAMFLFTFSLSVPVLTAPQNTTLLSYAHIASVVFIYGLIFLCFRIQLLVTNHFFKRYFVFFNITLAILAVFTLYFMFKNMQAPSIGEKFIIWHIDGYAGAILSTISLSYGLFWAYLFRKVAKILENKTLQKRMSVFSINGVLYGLAGFLLFGSDSIQGQTLSILLFTISGFLSSAVFIAPFIKEFFNKKRNQVLTA